jgi:DNA-binding response OmpR family regulator
MSGIILVYGNEPMLVTTRGLILERAGYKVFTAQTFANAMLVLMHHPIDLCVLCQSLKITNGEVFWKRRTRSSQKSNVWLWTSRRAKSRSKGWILSEGEEDRPHS